MAATALSFLTWIFLQFIYSDVTISIGLISAVGLTYFLLHVVALAGFWLKWRALFRSSGQASGIGLSSSSHYFSVVTTAIRLIRQSSTLRSFLWSGVLIILGTLILTRKNK